MQAHPSYELGVSWLRRIDLDKKIVESTSSMIHVGRKGEGMAT